MNITIGRLPQDPSVHMIIQPEDRRWQLLVDPEGFPHLYIQVQVEAGPDTGGRAATGMLCIEDLIPLVDGEPTTIPDLMRSTFGGTLTADEDAAARADFARHRAVSHLPCPR